MSIKERIGISLTETTTFECEFCGLTFDQERLNCPACGYGVQEVETGR